MLADEPTPMFMLTGFPPVEGYIEVNCDYSWQEFFLILCWAVDDGNESYGKELYELDENTLKNIFSSFDGDNDYKKFNHFFDEFIYLIKYKEKSKKYSGKKLSKIINENKLFKYKGVWNKLKYLLLGKQNPIRQKKIEKPKVTKPLSPKNYKYRDKEVLKFIRSLQISLTALDIKFTYIIIDKGNFIYFYLYEETDGNYVHSKSENNEILSFTYRRMWNEYSDLKIGSELFEKQALKLGMNELGGVEFNSDYAERGSPFRNWYLEYNYYERVKDNDFKLQSKDNEEFFKALYEILIYYFKLFHPKLDFKKILNKITKDK